MDRIHSGTFTKAQCQQFAAAVVPLAIGEPPNGKRTRLTEREAASLVYELRSCGGVGLTADHTEQGIAWLSKRAKGETMAQHLGLPNDWRERFERFSYSGDAFDISHGRYRPQFIPVWNIELADGEVWEYFAASWQAGGFGEAWPAVVR